MLPSQLEITVKPGFLVMLLQWKLMLKSYDMVFYSNFCKRLHVEKNVCCHLDVIRSDVWLNNILDWICWNITHIIQCQNQFVKARFMLSLTRFILILSGLHAFWWGHLFIFSYSSERLTWKERKQCACVFLLTSRRLI